jgi:hypothetical protein
VSKPGNALSAPAGNASAAETSIRQLIANGKFKTALDQAKEHHKKQADAASQTLLIDAYGARIRSLLEQNLDREAKALMDLVSERYPSAGPVLAAIAASLSARTGVLDDLVRPLNDPLLAPEHRQTIEQAIRCDVHDLAALAACAALPPEHPLRQTAAALDRAFRAAVSGPVAEDAIALSEVSRRSPLAPWKLLIRAIAAFYRSDDAACRAQLDAIASDSAAARLVPAMRALLGDRNHPAPLTSASTALISQVAVNRAALHRALEAVDRAFATDQPDSAVLNAVRLAVQECSRTAPAQLSRLKQHISVRFAVADFEAKEADRALGGPARKDAYYCRLMARGFEQTGNYEDFSIACSMWDDFRRQAVHEGWFPPNGPEAAALYLHMAGLARKIPSHSRLIMESQNPDDQYFIHPEQLYQRACAFDPHSAAFSEWMDYARRQAGRKAEAVAEGWRKACPADLEPVLYLMEQAAQRKAFPTALKHLARAEAIDGVHPQVRRARLRLLAGSILRHLQQNKPHLAREKLAAMAALPETQQGDRPAFLAALRFAVCGAAGERDKAAAAQAEAANLLGAIAANLLTYGIAVAAKQPPPPIQNIAEMPPAALAAIPEGLAKVMAVGREMNVVNLSLPWPYIEEAGRQIPGAGVSLDTAQLRFLAEAGLSSRCWDLAHSAIAAGLQRGGPTEARFLLLRAQCLSEYQFQRRCLCAAAVVQIAGSHRDAQLLDDAVSFLAGPLQSSELSLTAEEAAEVLRKEKALSRSKVDPGPDYSDLLERKLCNCAKCRAARGEDSPYEDDEFDPDEDESDPDLSSQIDELLKNSPPPPGLPPEIARMLLEEAARAAATGEPIDSVLSRLFGSLSPPRPGKKRKR